jgi:hypothetical protein
MYCRLSVQPGSLAVTQILFVHLAVDGAGKEMEERSSACLATNAGMPLAQQSLCKGRWTFAELGTRKSAGLTEREVAGKHCNDVENQILGSV